MTATTKEIAGDKYVLWGASWSLYTAKVRPYLIKKKKQKDTQVAAPPPEY